MILVVCTDDPALVRRAQQSASTNPAVFGQVYQVFGGQLPVLGAAEDLFVSAHGAYDGDNNNPVIGDRRAAFYVDAVALWVNIQGIFPMNYSGRVYIMACESANHGAGTFSFAEVFRAQIQAARPRAGAVYGQRGAVGGLIPPPGSPGWVQA